MTAPLKSFPSNSTPSGDALLASIEASLMSGFEVPSAPPTEFPERHPIAEEFNLPSGINYDALLKDIREFGQKEPIRRHSGKVLDGSDRLRACRELGIPPIYEDYEGDDPLHEFLRLNVVRRHLSPGQYASILQLSTDPDLLARHGGPRGQAATLQHVTVAALANQAGVSPRTQARAVKVFKANPNTLRRVIGGELSLEKAEALEYPKVVKSDPEVDLQTDAGDGHHPSRNG